MGICLEMPKNWVEFSLGAAAYPVNESKSIRLEVTDEFYLSPIVRTDKAAYLKHFADPEIAHNLLAIPFPYTEADADWWLEPLRAVHRLANDEFRSPHAIRLPHGCHRRRRSTVGRCS